MNYVDLDVGLVSMEAKEQILKIEYLEQRCEYLQNQTHLNESVAEKVIAQLKEAKPGLWANINAKQERGEKPSHGNSDAHKSAVKAGKKINKLNEDEEDQFAAELDGFADQLAAEIKNELEDHKEEIQKSDKELNEAAVSWYNRIYSTIKYSS
jgi:uncharacterized protein YjbJ (UPF0337 family)